MHKLIDFSTKDSIVPVVVQPDFTIGMRQVSINYYEQGSTPQFRVAIGCQGLNVTKTILKILLRDIEFPDPKPLTKKVIVKKGCKPGKSAAKFSEESTSYYISESGKVYSKSAHELGDVTYTEESKYFRKSGQSYRASANSGYWYSIDTNDIAKLKRIFKTMDAFFNPAPVEPKPAKKKAVK